MPKAKRFLVTVEQKAIRSTTIEVKAVDAEAARRKADKIIWKAITDGDEEDIGGWSDFDSDEPEVINVQTMGD